MSCYLFRLDLGEFPEWDADVGTVVQVGNGLMFRAKDLLEDFPQFPIRTDPEMLPLLAFLQAKGMEVKLSGARKGDDFLVTSLEERSREMGFKLSAELVERIATALRGDYDPITRYIFRKGEEAEVFEMVLGSRLPDWVRRGIRKNAQLHKGGGSSNGRTHALNALNYLCNINWTPAPAKYPSVQEARQILDDTFYGMETVKTRILEMLAQMNRTGRMPKWGLLLNGPAGVGKSSILKALARILNMPLVQIDISSVGKEVDPISGSSRIYSNAEGGKILQGMYQYGTCRAIVVINELDKCSDAARVSDVLLTLVDKLGFYENFLEECLPTQDMFFVASSNELQKISEPMQNRFLTVELPGYSPREKAEILQRFVLPGVLRENAVDPRFLTLEPEAVEVLIREYASEPGVRDLEQYIQAIAGDFVLEQDGKAWDSKRVYRVEDLRRLFGPSRKIVTHSALLPGTATSGFYLEGKARLFEVQASIVRGIGECKVLGPFTELQKQYVETVVQCIRNCNFLDLERSDITVFTRHPIVSGMDNSLGMAVFAAICSAAMKFVVDPGKVLFVGGCDLYGNLYFEEWDLLPLLQTMKERGFTTLYAPLGTGRLMEQIHAFDGSITVIEAPDAMTLFSLAVAGKKRAA